MEFTSLAEIMTAVVMVLGTQKGYEVYKRKRFEGRNGGAEPERRRHSLADSDKVFIRGCFEDQTKSMGLVMENDRLKLVKQLEDSMRADGEKTRVVVRSLS